MKQNKLVISLVVFVVLLFAGSAFAAPTGTALPWEGPLTTVQQSITGPVAIAIALIAIAVAGAMLIFGGEINNFARTGVYIALVLGLLVVANNVLTSLYGTSTVIPESFKTLPIEQTPEVQNEQNA